MHSRVKVALLLGIFLLTCSAALAEPGPSPADDRGSMVLTFKDGHRQRFAMSEIARLDFKTPATIIFKDGHQQNIPAADIARIEFEYPDVSASVPGRAHFVGKWEVGEGNGRTFIITLEADATPRSRLAPPTEPGPWSMGKLASVGTMAGTMRFVR